jgi:hypothetical protein
MIPDWLLTLLHYASLASAMAILLLLAWQPVRHWRDSKRSTVPRGERDLL